MIQVFGLGMSESLGAAFNDGKKQLKDMRLPELRKLLEKQMGSVLRLTYPHGYLFLIRGTVSPLQTSQEKTFRAPDVVCSDGRVVRLVRG